MDKEKVLDLNDDIKKTLQNQIQIQTTKQTEQIIRGQGFLNLKISSQIMEIL